YLQLIWDCCLSFTSPSLSHSLSLLLSTYSPSCKHNLLCFFPSFSNTKTFCHCRYRVRDTLARTFVVRCALPFPGCQHPSIFPPRETPTTLSLQHPVLVRHQTLPEDYIPSSHRRCYPSLFLRLWPPPPPPRIIASGPS